MTIEKPQKPTRSKKSETLEVRIPHETKQAFLTACRVDGTTASEVVRTSVQTYLNERERPPIQEKRTLVMKFPEPVRRYGLRAAAGGLAAIGLTTFAVLPSAANPDFTSVFKKLDVNKDGLLTAEEFRAEKEDGDQVKVEHKVTRTLKGDETKDFVAAAPGIDIKQDAFAFWLPDEAGGIAKQDQLSTVEHREVRIVKHADDKDGAAVIPPTPTMDDIRGAEFQSFDQNKDGKVSLVEFQARHTAMLTRGFEILDSNKNGSLDQMEYAQIANPPIPALVGAHGGPNVPEVKMHRDGEGPSPEALKAAFTRLDGNKDGKLSLQEYLPPA